MTFYYMYGKYFLGLVCIGIGLISAWPMELLALDRGLNLKVSAQEEYNDNIFFSVDEEIEDYITTVSGELIYHNRKERSDADLTARVEGLYYQDRDEMNATDQFYKGATSLVFSPRWKGGVNAGYSQDSRPDRDIETTGLLLGTAKRDRWNGGFFANYQATENTDTTLSYRYNEATYDQDEFADMASHQAGIGLNHDWSKVFDNTSIQFDLNYGRYEYETANTNIYSGTLGFTHKISNLWTFSISGGARYQQAKFESLNAPDITDDKWGAVGMVAVDYKGEYGGLKLSGRHDVTPSSGLDGTTERSTLGLRVFYRLTQKSGVGLTVNYHINKADAGELATRDVDSTTWQIVPSIRISLIDDLYLLARYQYSQVDNQIADTTASRRYAVVQLSYDITLWD